MQRILVGFDGSKSSIAALKSSVGLAKRCKSELLGVIVEDQRRLYRVSLFSGLAASLGLIPEAESLLPPRELMEEMDKIEAESSILVDEFNSAVEGCGVKVDLVVESGHVGNTLARHAQEVDLVCLGHAGAHVGIPHAKKGETLLSLAERIETPILATLEEPCSLQRPLMAFDEVRPVDAHWSCCSS